MENDFGTKLEIKVSRWLGFILGTKHGRNIDEKENVAFFEVSIAI